MRKSTLNSSLVLLFLLIFIGCKVKKAVVEQVSSPPISNAALSKTNILDNIVAKQANFNTLSIWAKAKLDIDNNGNNVNMVIKIQKDKAIWISVTVIAGLEVARALITPDSIKIRNNIESEYTRKPFSYIYEFTNKQLNFNTLQATLAGNSMPEFLNDKSAVSTSDKEITLSGMLDNLIYSLTFNNKFRVIQTDLKDEKAGQTLSVLYGDFTSVSQQLIPQSVKIKSNATNKNINIDFEYNRVQIDSPVDLPFSIPQRFTIKD